jgi:hypothetical protein
MPSKPEIGFGPKAGLWEIETSIAELDLRRRPIGGNPKRIPALS